MRKYLLWDKNNFFPFFDLTPNYEYVRNLLNIYLNYRFSMLTRARKAQRGLAL